MFDFRDRCTVFPGPLHRGKLKTLRIKRDRCTVEKYLNILCRVENFEQAGPFHRTRSVIAPGAGEMMSPSFPCATFICG